MSKTGNLKYKSQVSLITGISIYILINNLYAIAETAVQTNTKQIAGESSSMPLVIGLVALIIIGAVIFMMTKKKDSGMKMPESNKITPPQPGAKSSITPPTPKTPVATPPKPHVVTPISTPKVEINNSQPIAPNITPPSIPKVETPIMPPPVMTPPAMNTPSTPTSSVNSEAKPLFDAGKLDNDLDSIFNDPSSPSKPQQEEKKAPLFDSNQLEDDLDALFVEVNKKPEQPKEEKKGLFDSNQLSNDLDNLFSESTPSNNNSSDNLADLFSSPAAPIQESQSSQQPQSTFSLDDLNFLSSDTKKEEPKNDSFSLPSLDLSSLTSDTNQSTKAETTKESSSFDLNDLSFLSNDTKKEEPKNDSFSLPSFNLSDITNTSSTPSKAPEAPVNRTTDKIDLTTTTMGLNISDYLNSIQKPEEKKEEGFSLTNTIPPHSLNVNDLNISSPVSNNTVSQAKADSGVISIGKMLVDQNALEEIIKKAEKGGKAGLTTTQVITAVKGRSLDTLLVDINNVQGILGSIIVGKDGLVIANTMPENIDKDLVGALTSSLFTNIDTQIKKLKKGNLKRLTVETLSGLYILTEIEMGTLVVFGVDGQKVNLSDIYKAITAVTGKK